MVRACALYGRSYHWIQQKNTGSISGRAISALSTLFFLFFVASGLRWDIQLLRSNGNRLVAGGPHLLSVSKIRSRIQQTPGSIPGRVISALCTLLFLFFLASGVWNDLTWDTQLQYTRESWLVADGPHLLSVTIKSATGRNPVRIRDESLMRSGVLLLFALAGFKPTYLAVRSKKKLTRSGWPAPASCKLIHH
jgi:hypothetical protein